MTPLFWAMVAVIVIAALGIVIFRAARKAEDKAAKAAKARLRTVAKTCAATGHIYEKVDETGWRCATCGNFVPLREGDAYGPAEEGRVDRRREER
jgi:hypothetical protein